MLEPQYINLQPTEIGVLDSASAIFSAKVASGKVGPENEDQVIEESVAQAIKMAKIVETRSRPRARSVEVFEDSRPCIVWLARIFSLSFATFFLKHRSFS